MITVKSLPVLNAVRVVGLIVLNDRIGCLKRPDSHVIPRVLIAAVTYQIVLDERSLCVACRDAVPPRFCP